MQLRNLCLHPARLAVRRSLFIFFAEPEPNEEAESFAGHEIVDHALEVAHIFLIEAARGRAITVGFEGHPADLDRRAEGVAPACGRALRMDREAVLPVKTLAATGGQAKIAILVP